MVRRTFVLLTKCLRLGTRTRLSWCFYIDHQDNYVFITLYADVQSRTIDIIANGTGLETDHVPSLTLVPY